MIAKLPYWVLTEKYPAFSETESKTAVEMVARLYGKVQELIDDYNSFIDIINKNIVEFQSNTTQDLETFKVNLENLIHNYIKTLDMKIQHHDREIQETIVYIKENITEVANKLMYDVLQNGMQFQTIYDEDTQTLTLILSTNDSEEGSN